MFDYFAISFDCYPDMELRIILCQGIFLHKCKIKGRFVKKKRVRKHVTGDYQKKKLTICCKSFFFLVRKNIFVPELNEKQSMI